MDVLKVRKKPVIVEAVRITQSNITEVAKWCGGVVYPPYVHVKTLEGTMTGHVGDYIIKGIKGEFYPCRADIFEETYEPEISTSVALPTADRQF